jgi:hypothetical protein
MKLLKIFLAKEKEKNHKRKLQYGFSPLAATWRKAF